MTAMTMIINWVPDTATLLARHEVGALWSSAPAQLGTLCSRLSHTVVYHVHRFALALLLPAAGYAFSLQSPTRLVSRTLLCWHSRDLRDVDWQQWFSPFVRALGCRCMLAV